MDSVRWMELFGERSLLVSAWLCVWPLAANEPSAKKKKKKKSPLLSSVVRCGMVGLQLHHREAQRGVLHCFEEVVGLAMPEGAPGGNANPKAPQFAPTVEQVRCGRIEWGTVLGVGRGCEEAYVCKSDRRSAGFFSPLVSRWGWFGARHAFPVFWRR